VTLVDNVLLCPSGCADTHQAPYRGVCEDCGCEYMTGGRETRLCWACADVDLRSARDEFAGPTQRPHGYTHDMQRRGTNREAFKLKQQAERKAEDMAKRKTQIERAIESLEAKKDVLEAAIKELKQQQGAPAPAKKTQPIKLGVG
jgi:hypothetical protein